MDDYLLGVVEVVMLHVIALSPGWVVDVCIVRPAFNHIRFHQPGKQYEITGVRALSGTEMTAGMLRWSHWEQCLLYQPGQLKAKPVDRTRLR